LKLRFLVALVCCGAWVSASMPASAEAASTEWGPIDLGSGVVAPGSKEKFTFVKERGFESGFADAALWAARGSAPGPTLCVVGGIHGDEINSVEIARRAFQGVDPQKLTGTLIVVPAANSLGFRTMNRYTIDRRDLNRAFPGSVRGSATSIMANGLFERVIRRCNYLIDLHTGSNFRTNMPQIRVDTADPASVALAEAFGVGIIIGGAGPAGSLRREATRIGVAAIIYEAGPPYVFLEPEIDRGVHGVLNVLDHLGMYETEVERTKSQRLAGSSWVRVPKGHGGIFLTSVKLGDTVNAGDLLGTVTDPVKDTTFEVRANRSGIVIGAALPQVVLSGYGLFHIGRIE